MSSIITAALIGWIPICLLFFVVMTPRRALIASYLGGWALLPAVAIDLPGLPDFSRVTASTIGSVFGLVIFGLNHLSRFRIQWFDLPAVGMAVLPFITSLVNGLGAYDGLSSSFSAILVWTFPYLLGRIFLNDLDGIRDLAVGMTVAGLVYAPLIAFEVGAGRLLSNMIYGTTMGMGRKYGLPDPCVFMPQRLILAIFIATTTIAAAGLHITGSVRSVLGLPTRLCVVILAGATLLSHQTAGVAFMVLGLTVMRVLCLGEPGPLISAGAVLAVPLVLFKAGGQAMLLYGLVVLGADYLRRSNPKRLVTVIILLFPLYIFVRATDLWSGDLAVSLAYQFLGLERAVSIGYRFMCENLLVEKALQRPIFGWGGWGRSRVDETYNGVAIVTDGLWIIIFGQFGLLGLASMVGLLSLPLVRFLKAYPIPTWRDPAVTPAIGLGIILQLYALDNLLNASVSPITLLISGALIALEAGHRQRSAGLPGPALAWADQLAETGHVEAAEAAYTQLAINSEPGSAFDAAEAWGRLADLRRFQGRWSEAVEPAERALALRASLVRQQPAEAGTRRDLADDAERLARCLARTGRPADALSIWGDVVMARQQLAHESGTDPVSRAAWGRSLNDLAWLACEHPDLALQDPGRAVAMAEMATRLDPARPTFWNTLGAAHYRAGHWREAIAALTRSVEAEDDGSAGASCLLLAMAHQRLGDAEAARHYLSDGEGRLAAGGRASSSLLVLWEEATALVGHPASG